MNENFKSLSNFNSISEQELAKVDGSFNQLAYDIGHGVGVVVNVISTLRGIKGRGYRPRH